MKFKVFKGSAACRHKRNRSQHRRKNVEPGWESSNWSGYALSRSRKGAFRSVSGFWIVPRVRSSRSNQYSSAWIGIDGFTNSSLIQTGTEHDYVNGKPLYYAWWEILPAAAIRIPYPVSPGNLMIARITRLRKNKWRILLQNRTLGWTFRKTTTYTGPANSAEWIAEAPSINGQTTTLARYKKFPFLACRVNGKKAKLNARARGIMIQNNTTVSTPSLPGKNRDSFTQAYGARIPAPPKLLLRRATIM